MFAQAPAYLTMLNCYTDSSLRSLPNSQCLGFGSGFIALQKLLKMSVSDLVGARVCQAWYQSYLPAVFSRVVSRAGVTVLSLVPWWGSLRELVWALHVTSMGHIQFGCKNAFLTQLEVPYCKCQFKIVAKTPNGLGMSKGFELDCSASIDH